MAKGDPTVFVNGLPVEVEPGAAGELVLRETQIRSAAG